MQIKIPTVYDTSHWERVPDFALVRPRPILVITKATEGTSYKDPTMPVYLADLKQDGIRRGVYHFFRKAYSATQQADWFVNYIRPHVTSEDILALDFEEGGETADQLIAFLDRLKPFYPTNITLLYSRRSLMDSIPMTQAQKDKLRNYHTWIAGYPFSPDLYSEIPNFYIPDPTRWGKPWLWQYTDRGLPDGTSGDGTDCNWIDPEFFALIGASTMAQYKVKTNITLRVRLAAPAADGTLGADAGKVMVAGDVFYSDQTNSASGVPWLRITQIVKAADGKALTPPAGSSWWCNGSAMYVELISAPPPAPVEPSIFITHEFSDVVTVNGKKYAANFAVNNVEYKPQA